MVPSFTAGRRKASLQLPEKKNNKNLGLNWIVKTWYTFVSWACFLF